MTKFLLICLFVIIIVIATVIVLHLFESKMVERNRDAVIADLKYLARSALEYYEAPLQIGGGDRTWTPQIGGEYMTNRFALWLNYLRIFQENSGDEFINENGSYKLWLTSWDDKTLRILGTGIETGNDGINPVQVRLEVNGPTKGVTIHVLN